MRGLVQKLKVEGSDSKTWLIGQEFYGLLQGNYSIAG
jgi:hypothetical protein